MIRYSAKRLARSMLTLFIIITVVFSLLRLMPVEGYFQNYEKMNDAQIQNGLRQLGLLDPLPVQLMNFYKQVLHGDLGVSNIYRMNVPITQIVAEKAPVSMMMGGMALCISLLLGLPMGAAMARGKGKWFQNIVISKTISNRHKERNKQENSKKYKCRCNKCQSRPVFFCHFFSGCFHRKPSFLLISEIQPVKRKFLIRLYNSNSGTPFMYDAPEFCHRKFETFLWSSANSAVTITD